MNSATTDGQEVKAVGRPERVESSSGKAADISISKNSGASTETGFYCNSENTAVEEQKSKRCVHVHGQMLMHYIG